MTLSGRPRVRWGHGPRGRDVPDQSSSSNLFSGTLGLFSSLTQRSKGLLGSASLV